MSELYFCAEARAAPNVVDQSVVKLDLSSPFNASIAKEYADTLLIGLEHRGITSAQGDIVATAGFTHTEPFVKQAISWSHGRDGLLKQLGALMIFWHLEAKIQAKQNEQDE